MIPLHIVAPSKHHANGRASIVFLDNAIVSQMQSAVICVHKEPRPVHLKFRKFIASIVGNSHTQIANSFILHEEKFSFRVNAAGSGMYPVNDDSMHTFCILAQFNALPAKVVFKQALPYCSRG